MHTEPPTPTAARVLPVRRGAIVAATALASAALMSACGSSSSSSSSTAASKLNVAKVALSIEGTIFEKRHLHATVTCPAAVPQEPGRTFECIATSRSVKPPHALVKTPFIVHIQNSKGYVTYEGK
jgi:hypothetical protein